MRISVDRDICVGSGTCVFTEPAVFRQNDEDGRVELTGTAPGDLPPDGVREAIARCPVGAILLAGD
jgi:ferredoxin